VFSTAFDEYALKAFEVNAIDYILKPVSEERVQVALNRVGKVMGNRGKGDKRMQREAIAQEAARRGGAQIPIWRGDRILLCKPSEVEYIVAEDKKLSIATSKGESYTCKETLNYWENRLKQDGFFRIHKGYLVNTEKIAEIIPWFNNTYMLKMKGTHHEIPVSRGFIKEFREIFGL
jgi:DNA-binding LytR/AlgR family response regulator